MNIITIDGSAGSGKTTLGTKLAQTLGYHYLDSGFYYRWSAYIYKNYFYNQNFTINKIFLTIIKNLNLYFDLKNNATTCYIKSDNINNLINKDYYLLKQPNYDKFSSKLASITQVRKMLIKNQQNHYQNHGLIAIGRDMGTTIFPQAKHKIFLNINEDSLQKRGLGKLAIRQRNLIDTKRKDSPLKPALDAIIIDTSNLNKEQLLKVVIQKLNLN